MYDTQKHNAVLIQSQAVQFTMREEKFEEDVFFFFGPICKLYLYLIGIMALYKFFYRVNQ